ncbi:MAG TPA: FKBP-type peptidyl-prolyl cis-trans isomerase [Bacteroidales bacterium]|nr:FKBP-type peptidyl-prolyl cis-trans isomerase [Bacteroidales bacterium]HPT21011.1 FKBP-type peptidyl-prolyl cis-trans isomerase [Bacteroidales bacterium]
MKRQNKCLKVLNTTITLLFLTAFVSCKNNSEKSISVSGPGKEAMIDLNRYLIQKDRERIQNYIERKNLRMTETSTGLWYQIVKGGEGNVFKDNSKVIFEYDCSLIDGTLCYSSKELGPKEVVLGRTQIESGMNEGLRMLRPGAEAIFIIPPFLGYGLIGDGKKIPPRSVIVYNIIVK